MGLIRVLIVSIAVAALWSCGGDGPNSDPEGNGTGVPPATNTESGVFGLFVLAPGQLAQAMSSDTVSAYQKNLIQDGRLTFAEYEAAALATVDCLEKAGYAVFHVPGELEYNRALATPGPGLSARGRYTFDIGADPSNRAGLLNDSVRCRAEFFDLVDLLWAEHTAPTEHDLQLGRAMIGACLRGKGLSVPENPSQKELFVHAWPPDGDGQGRGQPVADYWDCAKEAADELGLTGFIG